MKYTVISFSELSRLDSSSVSTFRKKLAQVTTDNDAVLIDLTSIDFIDSRGLGAIISVVNSMREETKLLLCGIKENVRRVMELTRLHTILPLCSSVTTAIEMLQQESRELKTT